MTSHTKYLYLMNMERNWMQNIFQKKIKSILKVYLNGLKIEPENQDFKYLLALIYRDQGKFKSGQRIMQELKAAQQKGN